MLGQSNIKPRKGRDATVLAYGAAVSVIFAVAMLPELKQYIRFKREGKVDLAAALQSTDIRGISKMAERLGLLKDQKA